MRRIFLYSSLALAVIVTCDVLLMVWWSGGFQPIPTILANLPGSWNNDEFKRQVRNTFPIGSSEDQLVATLAAQGFKPNWPQRDDGNSATYFKSGFLCIREAKVLWRSDSQGVIIRVDGLYHEVCNGA